MTTSTLPMLETYPAEINLNLTKLASTIDALTECSEACTACADACLSEGMVADLTKTIRTNMDCADICNATARVLSRHTGYDANITRSLLEACIMACRSAADECDEHAEMPHCSICAEVCRSCQRSCEELLAYMG